MFCVRTVLQPIFKRPCFSRFRVSLSRAYAVSASSPIKAEKVVVFSNGYGLISSRLYLPVSSTSVEFKAPSRAVLGTLWVHAPSEVTIESVKSAVTSVADDVLCASVADVLQANIGQVMEVAVGSEWVSARVTAVEAPSGGSAKGLLVLQGERGTIVYPLADVRAVRLPLHPPAAFRAGDFDADDEQVLNTHLTAERRVDMLRVSYRVAPGCASACSDVFTEAAGPELKAELRYVTAGLGWLPSYKLHLLPDPGAAADGAGLGALSMQCVLLNDVDDMRADEVCRCCCCRRGTS
eukprot:TRINITY_DN4348_c0_g1_i1.p1 TRINITY_DN4348_c0_g1~~TRINITY_DN4348_c0_g1_i1.p1  ORF type:complete len:294 (+),score=82.28 TRINITY_DN4348_c0_g1_i1:226-1107(+)